LTLSEKMPTCLGLRACVSVTNGPFIDGRMTGIEPARGGFTIHCLDPLGYIRPYPRAQVSVSIYDQILSSPGQRSFPFIDQRKARLVDSERAASGG
jgi:hypothetical protein